MSNEVTGKGKRKEWIARVTDEEVMKMGWDSWWYRWVRVMNEVAMTVRSTFIGSVVLAVQWHCIGRRWVLVGIVILVDCFRHDVVHCAFVHWGCYLHNWSIHFLHCSIRLNRQSLSHIELAFALLSTYRGRVCGSLVRTMTSLVTSIMGLKDCKFNMSESACKYKVD